MFGFKKGICKACEKKERHNDRMSRLVFDLRQQAQVNRRMIDNLIEDRRRLNDELIYTKDKLKAFEGTSIPVLDRLHINLLEPLLKRVYKELEKELKKDLEKGIDRPDKKDNPIDLDSYYSLKPLSKV